MSSKLGLILSMFFVALFFGFSVDLTTIQYVYSALDSKATVISYKISKHGSLEESFVKSIEAEYNVSFTCLDNCNPQYGDVVNYKISTEITPLIISTRAMKLSVKRSAVIGINA